MTTASRPLATALWGARFAGDWLPSCYTTWGDTTAVRHEFHINFRIRCSLSSADECVFILEKMPE